MVTGRFSKTQVAIFVLLDYRDSVNHIKSMGLCQAGLLYISTSVWVLRSPNAGRNSHFPLKMNKKNFGPIPWQAAEIIGGLLATE